MSCLLRSSANSELALIYQCQHHLLLSTCRPNQALVTSVVCRCCVLCLGRNALGRGPMPADLPMAVRPAIRGGRDSDGGLSADPSADGFQRRQPALSVRRARLVEGLPLQRRRRVCALATSTLASTPAGDGAGGAAGAQRRRRSVALLGHAPPGRRHARSTAWAACRRGRWRSTS